MQKIPKIFSLLALSSACAFAAWNDDYKFPALRDPYAWPFTQNSIWNTPIGSNAKYVPAEIKKATLAGMSVDEDIIILKPSATPVDIVENDAGWDPSKTRCNSLTGRVIDRAPIPSTFSTDPGYIGHTPNMAAAILKDDGTTLIQNQPFHRCGPGEAATSQTEYRNVDIYKDDGIMGSHGGTAMSALGGALRLGELVPGAPPIHHVLKIELDAPNYACRDGNHYRWPADKGDACGGSGVHASVEGALYALPPSIDIASMGLETEPAKYLARALQDYGAYAVDNTGWNVYCLATEWSPNGRVVDEFEKAWGFKIDPIERKNAWSRDMDKIFMALNVVDNNVANNVGGGGNRRAPMAPSNFGKPGSAISRENLMAKQAQNRGDFNYSGSDKITTINGRNFSLDENSDKKSDKNSTGKPFEASGFLIPLLHGKVLTH